MRKSKEHLDHVWDYTVASLKPSINQDNESLLGVTVFSDLFTSLIKTGWTVSLAIIQSTGIDNNSHKVSAISAAELEVDKSNIKLLGQVLHLTAHSTSPLLSQNIALDIDLTLLPPEPIVMSTATSSTEILTALGIPSKESLIWNGNYIKFNALKSKKDKGLMPTSSTNVVSCNALLFSIPSTFAKPVTGTLKPSHCMDSARCGNLACLSYKQSLHLCGKQWKQTVGSY